MITPAVSCPSWLRLTAACLFVVSFQPMDLWLRVTTDTGYSNRHQLTPTCVHTLRYSSDLSTRTLHPSHLPNLHLSSLHSLKFSKVAWESFGFDIKYKRPEELVVAVRPSSEHLSITDPVWSLTPRVPVCLVPTAECPWPVTKWWVWGAALTRHNYPSQGQTFKLTSKQKLACTQQSTQTEHSRGRFICKALARQMMIRHSFVDWWLALRNLWRCSHVILVTRWHQTSAEWRPGCGHNLSSSLVIAAR